MIREQARRTISGWFVVAVALVLLFAAAAGLYVSTHAGLGWQAVASALLLPVAIFLLLGLFTVGPNEAKCPAAVRRLPRHGQGTPGLRWANPFYTKRRSRCACATSRARS